MNLSYRKDGNENFMIIKERKIDENDYKFQMITNNKIEGIVPMSIKKVNNQAEIYYNVSSLVPLGSLFTRKQMTGEQLYDFVRGIKNLSETIREFLISMNDFILQSEFIYFNQKTKKYMFCFLPGQKQDFQEQLRDLFDKLLEYINHNDREAVLIGYGIQQITTGADFTIEDLIYCANNNRIKKVSEEEKRHSVVIPNVPIVEEDTKKETKQGFFENLLQFFRGKSKYQSESEIEEEKYSMIPKVNYGQEGVQDTDDLEEETRLLTATGMIPYIALTCMEEENSFRIMPATFPFIIGKSKKSCDYPIDNPVISRVHLRILEREQEFLVEDLNSTNGTLINGERLYPHQPQVITRGDKVTIANLEFIVE